MPLNGHVLDRVLAQHLPFSRPGMTAYSEPSMSILINCIREGDEALILAMRSLKTSTLTSFTRSLRFPSSASFDSHSENPQSDTPASSAVV